MKHNDLVLEMAAADNFHPDQVWARRLQRQLARAQYDSAFIEQAPDKELANVAVQFSSSETIKRITHLFSCVRLAEKNDNSDPEFPKNPEVKIVNFKSKKQ